MEAPPRAGDARVQLLEAALHVLAQHGYRAVGLRDLATQAGVTTGSIYHHFASKEDLFRQAVDHYAELILAEQEALASASGTAAEQLWALTEWLVAGDAGMGWRRDFMVAASVELYSIELPSGESRTISTFGPLYRRLRDVFTRVVRQPLAAGVASGELRLPEDADVDDMATLIIAGVVGILQMHARDALPIPLRRALRLHIATMLRTMS
jgi:AcrR family transcriptional regulator